MLFLSIFTYFLGFLTEHLLLILFGFFKLKLIESEIFKSKFTSLFLTKPFLFNFFNKS